MTADWKDTDEYAAPRSLPPSEGGDLISPVMYELVMWGFAERNSDGQRLLRRDIQARLDGDGEGIRALSQAEGDPLYVGYRCQACWEAAVTLVTYGQHLCARESRSTCHLH